MLYPASPKLIILFLTKYQTLHFRVKEDMEDTTLILKRAVKCLGFAPTPLKIPKKALVFYVRTELSLISVSFEKKKFECYLKDLN